MMHDLDRTLQEFEAGTNGFDAGEFEFESEGEWEFDDEAEFEGEWEAEGEWEGEYDGESVFDEVEEMELAATLLDSTDQQELDDFMGRLVRRAGRALGRAVRSPVGRAVGGALRNVARKALPAVGAALGTKVGLGPATGARIASGLGQAFGLELEGLSPQDQEFEVARRLVRLGGAAVQQAVENPRGRSPTEVAKNAVVAAARQHAPGLVRDIASRRRRGRRQGESPAMPPGRIASGSGGGASRTGRWVRRGNQIILMGV
jgi:hypothetical protein